MADEELDDLDSLTHDEVVAASRRGRRGAEDTSDRQERLLHVLIDRNRAIREQTQSVGELTTEVRQLRTAVDQRPTREEVVRTRRQAIRRSMISLVVIMLVTAYGAIFLHEQYRNACATGPIILGTEAPRWCGSVFPGGHDYEHARIDPGQINPTSDPHAKEGEQP